MELVIMLYVIHYDGRNAKYLCEAFCHVNCHFGKCHYVPLILLLNSFSLKKCIFMQLGFSSDVALAKVTLTNLIKDFSFCTESNFDRLPKWSWHVFSQFTTDLFSKRKVIIPR